MGIKTSKEKIRELTKLNRKTYTPVPFPAVRKANNRSLSACDLGPLSQHHCMGHVKVADEDLSTPERSLRKKRTRRTICRNVQFVES